jgi:PAS domain S-box-containing protein
MQDAQVKVLLVDDDEDDYIITRDLISAIGGHRFDLEWINNYREALPAIQRRAHDIYLLDFRLGESTGLELLREAKVAGCIAPMILLTGQGDREVDVEAMKAGAADYLVKGQLNSDGLERAMRYAIEGKRAEENLRRERDLISRINETSPVGIVVADRSGTITFANHRSEEVLGLAKGAVARGACNVLKWLRTDQEGNPLPGQPSPLQPVLEEGRPVQDERHAIDRTDGHRILISTNAAPLFDAAGNVDGMVVSVEDISERLSLEAQLRQSQKMECVGQLAAGVAHDINNVLTIIQGHARLLINNAPADAPVGKSLEQISLSAERAARFIRQLLMFSRKQVIQTKLLDLNDVLHNLENMLSRMVGEDVSLEMRYDREIPCIEADVGMVEQIIMNLAVNSRDAMPKGGKLSVATRTVAVNEAYARQNTEARPGQFVCLAVTDTGCGIDPKALQKIFEPFFSTKEVGKGTGLGLATVYGIVKQHRGWIEVESEVGKGTTFKIFLPGSAHKKASTPEAAGKLSKPEAVRGGNEKILIVEDETGLREIVHQILQQYNYQVAVAASGAEALNVWDEYNGDFDLLLTDMIMPGGMTGRELAEELKRRKPDLKIIYSSGYSPDLIGKNLDLEQVTVVSKPYLPSQLLRVVREVLDAVSKKHSDRVPA